MSQLANNIKDKINMLKFYGGSLTTVMMSREFLTKGDLTINNGTIYTFEGETSCGHLLFRAVRAKA